MKIAIAQLNPTIGNLRGNAQNILQVATVAAQDGVSLLLTPELSLCGYPPRDLLFNHSFVKSMEEELVKLAGQLPPDLFTLVGLATANREAAWLGEKPLHNTMALVNNGEIHQIFAKQLLPTYDVFDEARYFEPGKTANYFVIERFKIGVTICEDLWNDEQFWGKRSYETNPIQDLADLGVDLMVNLSASPYSLGKQKLREAMVIHTAKTYEIPIIYVNQVGGNDDLIFDGNSVAFNRRGEIVCRAKSCQQDYQIIEWDSNRNDLAKSSINPPSSSQEAEIWDVLVLGVKDYARKCGFPRAVLGLSGGIDSSLVATIAAEALGRENVLGVLMPSPYSSSHSITDAEKLGQNLGIKSEKLPIAEIMQSYDRLLGKLFAGTEFGVAEENLQSRIRGNLLMALANKFGYLLLSTGNKSEMAVGYCTLYGDMNGGLAVIADVPKTTVFALCHWLNRDREIIPNHVLIKPPSAELKPNQLDRDSLPAYDILDGILELLINQHRSEKEIIAAGYQPEIVQKVNKLVARAEFKRKQAPPGLKITDRAFGTGWRMPIASNWY